MMHGHEKSDSAQARDQHPECPHHSRHQRSACLAFVVSRDAFSSVPPGGGECN